jgi:hypothetical protein
MDPDKPPLPGGKIREIVDAYEVHRRWADELSTHYMRCYRSAFAGTYLLGTVAVVLAVLATLEFRDAWPSMLLALIELFVVSRILRIYKKARHGDWHTRAVDYRLLAEMFRHTQFLAVIGAVLPEARLPRHWGDVSQQNHWVYWHYGAVVRDLDFGLARGPGAGLMLDGDYLKQCRDAFKHHWIGDQATFHGSSWRRYKLLESFLHRAGRACFWVVPPACLLHVLTPPVCRMCGVHEGGHGGAAEFVTFLALWHCFLLMVGAGAPALAGALHAIVKQAEAARLSDSYERMEAMLDRSVRQLDRMGANPTLQQLNSAARLAAELMLGEVEDWQTAFRYHDVETT